MTQDTEHRGTADLNARVREVWERKAAFWDEAMGEGNPFHLRLVAPAAERLLDVRPGELVLDVACGNGQFSRRLAELGARVVATDFSEAFLERARARSEGLADRIEYVAADATDEAAMLALGERRFDAAVCLMALMDMARVEPLFRALARLLGPEGRFVFAVSHPCFNNTASSLGIEEELRDGRLVETRYVKVSSYLNLEPARGVGIPGEPEPHYYFDRPLSVLLGPAFEAGFALDGLEEPAFGSEDEPSRPLGWAALRHIPPVLAGRLRLLR